MRSLARYILTGPVQAILVVLGFALLSFPFPFLLIVSSGALALVILQLGFKQGVNILAVCSIFIALSAYFVFGKIIIEPLIAWISIMAIASLYRYSQSLNVTLQLLTIIGMLFVVLLSILIPDLQGQWLKIFQNILNAASEDPAFNSLLKDVRLTGENFEKYLPIAASVITGALVGVYLITSSITLFLGRWWQSVYANTQAFRTEFIALRLGTVLAVVAILFVIASLLVNHAILWQLSIVCLSMFSLQGMAIAHALIGQLSSPMIGFIAVYGLLFIAAPQMLMALSTLGVLDTFINFRTRFAKSNT